MITAKNYVAQAAKSLTSSLPALRAGGLGDDADALKESIASFTEAVHFALPDDGVIFDDALRDLRGTNARLPFENITIEYYSADKQTDLNKELTVATKRLIHCWEVSRESIGGGFEQFPSADHFIFITAFFENIHKVWTPCLGGVAVPSTWDEIKGGESMVRPIAPPRDGTKMAAVPIPFMRQMFARAVQKCGQEKADQSVAHDIGGEIRAVLEMCEALSCKNVTHEPIERIDPAINAKRVRAGKLPLYETRQLVIDAGKSASDSSPGGGTHASPRQHLRRGHIRRLPSGNIWVNSCVVGRAENGVIEKNYVVRGAQ